MDPRHHLIHKIDPNFKGFKIRHDIKQRYRKFIWGTFTGDSTRSYWKPRRKTITHFRKMYHVDYDSDHDDYEFLTHPKHVINAQKRRRALRIVKLKLQKLFNKEEDRYKLQKLEYAGEEFKPDLGPRTMKLNLNKSDQFEDTFQINSVLPFYFNGGFLTYLQEKDRFTKDLYYKLQNVFRNKKLRQYGMKNVFNYIKNGVRLIGKKYQKNEMKDNMIDNEINNLQGEEGWRQLRVKAHPYIRHYETNENLKDEKFQALEVKLGEDGQNAKNYGILNITETFQNIGDKLKQIIQINPKSLFRFSYFIKSLLYLLQIEFQEKEVSQDLMNLIQNKSRAIFQIKKKGEEMLRQKQMRRSNKQKKLSETQQQYKLLVKKIQSEVNKKEKQKEKENVPFFQLDYKIESKTKRLQWLNDKEGIKKISQIIGNEQSFLHQDDIFVDQSKVNEKDYESLDEDQPKRKIQKQKDKKKNNEKSKKNKQRKIVQQKGEQKNMNWIRWKIKKLSIRFQKQQYHKAIRRYHDLRMFQDLLDKEDIGFPQEYLQYVQIDENVKQDRQSSRRSKSVPSRSNKQRKIKEIRSYSQEKMDDLLEKFDSIAEKECQRDLFRIASTMMQQKQCSYKNNFYSRIRKKYSKNYRSRISTFQFEAIMDEFYKEDSKYSIEDLLKFTQATLKVRKQKEYTRYERHVIRKQNQNQKRQRQLIKSEDDYQHRIFLKQLVNSDKKFFSKIFGIDVVGNYLHYYKMFASQLFDNCQLCLDSENENEDEGVQQDSQQESDENNNSPKKGETQEEKIIRNKQIMPMYLKLAKKEQKQKQKQRAQKVEVEQNVSEDEFAFENEKLENIDNFDEQFEDEEDYYGMKVEINDEKCNNEDNQNDNANDFDNEEVGFRPNVNKEAFKEQLKDLNKFKKIYLGRNKLKQYKENNNQIDLKFPLFQDMYKDETYNDCFSKDGIYFDKIQRGQHQIYQQLLLYQCRPQVPLTLQKDIEDSKQHKLFRVLHKNFNKIELSYVLQNLNLKDLPLPIEIVMEKRDLLISDEFKETKLCLRTYNLPIKPIRQMNNQFDAQINFYRKFAQYSGLQDMPKRPDTPYQTFKKNLYKGQHSPNQRIKAVKAWVTMNLKDRQDYVSNFYRDVVLSYRKLDKWLKQANINQEDLDIMGVMDIEDFVWHLHQLDVFWEYLERQAKIAAVSFDDVIIQYGKQNLRKRHPDKMTKQRIERELKLKRDPKARAKAQKQEMRKRAKQKKIQEQEKKRELNIARLKARRNKKQQFIYAKYFGKKGPLLTYFENVFVKSLRKDVHGIMKKKINKYKFKQRYIYIEGKGYQKDDFIRLDQYGHERVRVPRIFDRYAVGDLLQGLMDQQQIKLRNKKNWVNQDYLKVPPIINKPSNIIQSDHKQIDSRNQVRVCQNLYFDNISQKTNDLAQQQNIQSNQYLIHQEQENLGFTTVLFNDKEWLVGSNDIQPFKQLVNVTKELEQNEYKSLLKKKINAKNKLRRAIFQKLEIKYQRKRNLYIYRDLPDDQQPENPRAFIINVDKNGIYDKIQKKQDYIGWLQKIQYYQAKGYDIPQILRMNQINSKSEGQGEIPNLNFKEKQQFKEKLNKEYRIKKTKEKLEKNKFEKEKKKTQYLAAMLRVDENYNVPIQQESNVKQEQEDPYVEPEVPDIRLTDREKIRMRKFLKKLNIQQQDKSIAGIDRLTKFVQDNKDPANNLYENVVVAEQLEKEVKQQLSKRQIPERRNKPWYLRKFKRKPSPMRPFLDENGNLVTGIYRHEYIRELEARRKKEDDQFRAEIAQFKLEKQAQGMTKQQIIDELLKTPKIENQIRPQVRQVQLKDIMEQPQVISKKKKITLKKQDQEQSDSEPEKKKGRQVRQVSQKQSKDHQVQQGQTKGKQQNNIKPNNQQVKQEQSKPKRKPLNSLRRNDQDQEDQEEIESESQIIMLNKKRQRKVHKNKVPINFDNSDDDVGDEGDSEDINYDDSSDEQQKNKKKGGQKQKGKNNRK